MPPNNARNRGVRAPEAKFTRVEPSFDAYTESRNQKSRERELGSIFSDSLEKALRASEYDQKTQDEVQGLLSNPAVKREILTQASQTPDIKDGLQDLIKEAVNNKDVISRSLAEREKTSRSLKGKLVYWKGQLDKLAGNSELAAKVKQIGDRVKSLEKQIRQLDKTRIDLRIPHPKTLETPSQPAEKEILEEELPELPESAFVEEELPESAITPELIGAMKIGPEDESQRLREMPVITQELLDDRKKKAMPEFAKWVQGAEHPTETIPETPQELSSVDMMQLKKDAGIVEKAMMDETPKTSAQEMFESSMLTLGVPKKILEKYPTREDLQNFINNPPFSAMFGTRDRVLEALNRYTESESGKSTPWSKKFAIGSAREGLRTPSRLAKETPYVAEIPGRILETKTIDDIAYTLNQDAEGKFFVEFNSGDKLRKEFIKADNLDTAKKDFARRIKNVETGLANLKKEQGTSLEATHETAPAKSDKESALEDRALEIMEQKIAAKEPFSYLDAVEQAKQEAEAATVTAQEKPSLWNRFKNLFKSTDQLKREAILAQPSPKVPIRPRTEAEEALSYNPAVERGRGTTYAGSYDVSGSPNAAIGRITNERGEMMRMSQEELDTMRREQQMDTLLQQLEATANELAKTEQLNPDEIKKQRLDISKKFGNDDEKYRMNMDALMQKIAENNKAHDDLEKRIQEIKGELTKLSSGDQSTQDKIDKIVKTANVKI